MSAIAQALADKDFLTAHPNDQTAYLSSIDKDFAKASPEDQGAYLNHILAPSRKAQSAQPTQFEKDRPGGNTLTGDVSKGFAEPDVLGGATHAAVRSLKDMGHGAVTGLLKQLNPARDVVGDTIEGVRQMGHEAAAGYERGKQLEGLPQIGDSAGLMPIGGENRFTEAIKGG